MKLKRLMLPKKLVNWRLTSKMYWESWMIRQTQDDQKIDEDLGEDKELIAELEADENNVV